ncbi:UNVERIFIED_CONTAM: hypothetical protein GTU68_033480, partial [Idotea baltica]|nr:hypothetical protein [Idotea baltica]
RVGVIGASGFAGGEFLRLAARHPRVHVCWATGDSKAGVRIADHDPSLALQHGDDVFATFDNDLLGDVDLVVTALPHGHSQDLMPAIAGAGVRIIDLAADFRLHAAPLYDEWYGETHRSPELLGSFVYGLPELHRESLVGATRVAAPGCYPTAAILPLEPLVSRGIVDPSHVIIDAISGVSGAGRPPKENTTFCAVDESVSPYGVGTHRHTPEIEHQSGSSVLFTAHLAPMNRGILATIHGRPLGDCPSTDSLLDTLAERYRDHPFVLVDERLPATKSVQGSNAAHISVRCDPRTGSIVAFCAIDNLVKGTAGQALQCCNLMYDMPETLGLPMVGVSP